jgi:hypothetical protein
MNITVAQIYDAMGFIAVGGSLVTLIVQGIKKTIHLDEKEAKWATAAIHAFAIGLSGLAAIAEYFTQIHSTLPKSVMGLSTAAIYGVTMVVYNFAKLAETDVETVQAIATAPPTPPVSPAESNLLA